VLGKIPIAFFAGFVSFLAPCVLPLVPGYLSAVSAVEAGRLGQPGTARRVVVSSLPFVAGFTVVFVALGAGAGAAGGLLSQRSEQAIAGFVVIVLGLAFAGALPWPERLLAPGLVAGARRSRSNVLLGGAFGVCAAPCIGPVLASILVLAGDASTVAQGSVLLLAYSAGLAVPFLLAGIAFARSMSAFRWLRDHYAAIRIGSGAILVAVGLLLFFDRFWWLRVALNRAFQAVGIAD
jgi:cytochrome c-type biogenesis protein